MNRSSYPSAAHDDPEGADAPGASSRPIAPPPPAPTAGPFGAPDAAVAAALAARASLAFAPAAALPGTAPAAGLMSPCIGVCRLDGLRHHCQGCLRTLDEIRAWAKSDDAARRAVWTAVADRAGIALTAPAVAVAATTTAACRDDGPGPQADAPASAAP
jgi:predicted Fe-S protein YdhL (DUF1289 family)